MSKRNLFPFAAMVGQEQVKRALLIASVNPKVAGVLVSGAKGTGKSTMVRGLAEVVATGKMAELPLSVTEDMLFGSLDLTYALAQGTKRFSPGILAKAHGNILYVDDINLLRREFLNAILATAAQGVSIVEREGISERRVARYITIGTMNPEEGTLPPAVLDRFGLYAAAGGETTVAARVEIVRRVLAFEREPELFRQQYREMNENIRQQVSRAGKIIDNIEITQGMMSLAAQLSLQAHCAGHRAELFLLEAGKALAALAGREFLLPTDLEEAALFVLPHRMGREEQGPFERPGRFSEQQQEQEENRKESGEKEREEERQARGKFSNTAEPEADRVEPAGAVEPKEDREGEANRRQKEPVGPQCQESGYNGDVKDKTADIDITFPFLNLSLTLAPNRQVRRGSGKRNRTRSTQRRGRYVRAAFPCGPVTDLALDATLRAAAPYQKLRKKGKCRLTIQQEDLRQKVREQRSGNTFLFVVDASGSMGSYDRMRAVKGAIFAVLRDAYQKRDQVGLIAFRRQRAEVLLPVTRSVDLAQKCLRQLPTGGKTPLAEGLSKAFSLLKLMGKKEKELEPVLFLVTDGRANSTRTGNGDAVADALKIAGKIRTEGFYSVVIDTESNFVKLGIAQAVAHTMGSAYYSLQEISDEKIVRIVKNMPYQ
ncbi:von Willebrand factor type A domain protein [Acididesulfobacillus acetoxydans]|uniref:von Willebrand factor type A domain protein n=1 Tax=Acididesulfobacillus acetoxydans TaxID=1561005 RepID=A0A8S0Y4T5_9FIRM|nr:VWA domain-containing protein [Acididesulfobacillus acetoxydans]CAA7603225.1 von Willebrand factor type A domain protein [Acididesulfobacillus acetoxydans]